MFYCSFFCFFTSFQLSFVFSANTCYCNVWSLSWFYPAIISYILSRLLLWETLSLWVFQMIFVFPHCCERLFHRKYFHKSLSYLLVSCESLYSHGSICLWVYYSHRERLSHHNSMLMDLVFSLAILIVRCSSPHGLLGSHIVRFILRLNSLLKLKSPTSWFLRLFGLLMSYGSNLG